MTKRFTMKYSFDDEEYVFFDGDVALTPSETVKLLNEQQATINELKAQLREKEEDERLYANEIVKLNKEAKEVLDFKSLGGDY